MSAPHKVAHIDPSQTIPTPTGPPPSGSSAWDVARDVVNQGGSALERHQQQAAYLPPEQQVTNRPARPRASTLSIVTAAALVLFAFGVSIAGGLAYLGHQMGASGYEDRQQERHETVMAALAAHTLAVAAQTVELAAQRRALYQLIDTVAEHHPEAAKVGRQLERGRVKP